MPPTDTHYLRNDATVVTLRPKTATGVTVVFPTGVLAVTPEVSRALMTLLRSARDRRLARDAAQAAS